MAEMNKIKSFKSFSDILAQESEAKLAEENNLKRAELSTKIASILDSMNITSLEGLEEDQKTEIISQLFGEISEEETEEDVPVVNDEEEVEELTEAIKVEGKRDAKKVLTTYNKIFNKVLVDLGAMPNDSILGCIKYLMSEAMIDANFHREAASVSKMIKGNIKPLEIKMPGLGGHFIKIGPTTIKTILDKYYSDIANAAGWSGMGIAEGTALYLEQIKQEAMGQAVINKFNSAFEGADVRIDLDSKLNESKDSSTVTVSDETTKLEERNAFLGARAKAIAEDLEEFEFNGKTYKVTVNESNVLNEGTRGQFGKIDKAGNITSVYTHYDSYPENMLPIIKKSFKGGKNVDSVIDKGANSGLDADISKINFYNDGTTNTTGSIKNIDNYLKDADRDGGAEFVYLWDEKSKKWMMADIYGGSGLVPAFESVVTEAKFVKDFNRDVLNAKTKEEVLELYPNAEFFIGKSDHFFGELDGNLFFKAYYTKAQKEFEIKSVYSQKGSNYVHLYNESVVNEAEIKSDDEFKEYATTVLQKAFGEDYDEAKAGEVIDGILSKSDGDYGAAVGMLTSSLGESVVTETNADGTISDDEDDDMDNLRADVEFMTKELIDHITKETERIGGPFRAPGYEYEAKKIIKSTMQKKKFKL